MPLHNIYLKELIVSDHSLRDHEETFVQTSFAYNLYFREVTIENCMVYHEYWMVVHSQYMQPAFEFINLNAFIQAHFCQMCIKLDNVRPNFLFKYL